MENETPVVDATVVTPEVNPSVQALDAQKANFKAQLDQVKTEMTKLQQQFEVLKVRGSKLEGAIESLDILRASLTK